MDGARLAEKEKKRISKMRTWGGWSHTRARTYLVLQCKTPAYRSGNHSGIGKTRPRPDYICKAKYIGKDRRKGEQGGCSRLLDALGFDVPTCEVILEHAYETFFRFFTQFCTANRTRNNISDLPGKGVRHGGGTRSTQHETESWLRGAEPISMCWVSGACVCHAAANAEYKRGLPTQRRDPDGP